MTIQSKKLLELSPLSEVINKKKAPKTFFHLQNTPLLFKEHFLTTNANSPIAPPKTKTFHPALLLIYVFKATLTTKSIANFSIYQTHQASIHPVHHCNANEWRKLPHLLSPPPGVTSSFAFRLVRSAFFRPASWPSNAALLPQLAQLAGGEDGDDQRKSWEEEVLSKVQAVMGEMDTWHSWVVLVGRKTLKKQL